MNAVIRHGAGFQAVVLLAGAIAGATGCSEEHRSFATTAPNVAATGSASQVADVQDGQTPPQGLTTVSFEQSSLTLWPYTGTSFDGTKSDPVNLIFVGEADPVQIRAALLALNSSRPQFPGVYPFNARWSDAVGDVQTNYAGSKGWQGSVVQLQLGSYGPTRIHLRLWRTAAPFGWGRGTWTVGAVHFDLQIPGTAEHEAVAWELPQQVVIADMMRTGLLDPNVPFTTTGAISQTPTFRTIRAPIYNGMPDGLKVLLGLPPGQTSVPVGVPNDGLATIFHLVKEAPLTRGSVSDAFTVTYNQIIPKPFCADGPLDYVRVSGPVSLSRTTRIFGNGHYSYESRVEGRITVTPVDVTHNPPVDAGPSFQADIRDLQNGMIGPMHSWVTAESQRILPQDGGTETYVSKLLASSNGRKSYEARSQCLATPLP